MEHVVGIVFQHDSDHLQESTGSIPADHNVPKIPVLIGPDLSLQRIPRMPYVVLCDIRVALSNALLHPQSIIHGELFSVPVTVA